MKNNIIRALFILVFSVTACYGQDKDVPTRANKYDADSLKTGEWVYYFDENWKEISKIDKAVFYRLVTYLQGKPIGKTRDYYGNGQLQIEGVLYNEEKSLYEGEKISYTKNGQISTIEYFNKGIIDYKESISRQEANLAIISKNAILDSLNYSSLLDNLGLLYYRMGRYSEAEPLYVRGLKIKKEQLGESHPEYASSLKNLAVLYNRMGRYSEAEPLFVQVLKINKEQFGVNHTRYATSLNNFGLLYAKMGRYSEAVPLFVEVLEIYKEQLGENDPYYAISLNNLARQYAAMGRYSEAEPLFVQALKIYKERFGENHPHYAIFLNNLAKLYVAMSRYSKAETLYVQALKTKKEQFGQSHPQYAVTLFNIAALYQAMDKWPLIVSSYYQHCYDIYSKAFGISSQRVAATKRAMATFQYTQGHTTDALQGFVFNLEFSKKYLQEVFSYLGESERELFYKTVKDDFEQFIDIAIREYKDYPDLLSTAYNLQISYKAYLLNTTNQIKKRILASGDRRLITLYDQVQELKQFLGQSASLTDDELYKQHGVKRDSLVQILKTRDQRLTEFSEFYKVETKVPLWQDVQLKLGDKEALIEIVRYQGYDYLPQKFNNEARYAAFIITAKTKDNPAVVIFNEGNFLEQEGIDYYRKSIQFQLEDNNSYATFWQPLLKELKKIEKVYFAPDGVFNSINMKTLRNPETGTYLRDEIELKLITSSKDLLKVMPDVLPQKIGLLIGNPDFGGKLDKNEEEGSTEFSSQIKNLERGGGLVPLPGTEKEVKDIEELLKSNNWRLTTLLDADASEESLKNMIKPNILHIATHGFFQKDAIGEIKYDNNPLYRSGLLLSGATETLSKKEDIRGNVQTGKEDGVLTAFEALNLNIDNADLVVLSACETGLGEIRNGEGVFGLQRAFTLAGARTILMSLWKVNDQTTQELMVNFYTNWLTGMSKRAAFNKAQLQLKATYPHPYYWGAFVLIGE